MKKTQVFSTDVRYANTEIKKLEADGWEILSVQVLSVASEYLIEQYCTNYRADVNHLCEGCGLEILCDKYEGNSSYLWNFEDVEKAYELIGGKDE